MEKLTIFELKIISENTFKSIELEIKTAEELIKRIKQLKDK